MPQEVGDHPGIRAAAPVFPRNAAGAVIVPDQILSEHVHLQDPFRPDHLQRDIAPGRIRLRAGPACVQRRKHPAGVADGQKARVIPAFMVKAVADLRINFGGLAPKQQPVEVGDMNRMIDHRAAP